MDEIDSNTKVAAIEKDRYFSVTDTKVDKNNGSDASDTSDDIIKAIPAVILVALDKNSSSLFEGGLANLPQLHTLRAKAEYSATTHISFLGGLVPSNANLTSTLKINFSNYKAEFDVLSLIHI